MKGTNTGIRLSLVDVKEWTCDGKHYRYEQWTITGGEIDPTRLPKAPWLPQAAGWEPSSRFALYVVDGEIDPRLASWGGLVWPTVWPKLFQAIRNQTGIEITDEGLMFRAATLYGASDMYADVRLS